MSRTYVLGRHLKYQISILCFVSTSLLFWDKANTLLILNTNTRIVRYGHVLFLYFQLCFSISIVIIIYIHGPFGPRNIGNELPYTKSTLTF